MSLMWFKDRYMGMRSLLADLRRELVSLQPKESATIKWTKGPTGMIAHVKDVPSPSAGGGGDEGMLSSAAAESTGEPDVVLCQVSGGNAETGFTVTLYGNGKDQSSTGSGKLYAAELAINSTIPSGSWIIGHRAMLVETGGNET